MLMGKSKRHSFLTENITTGWKWWKVKLLNMHLGVRYRNIVYNDGEHRYLVQVERNVKFSKQSGTAFSTSLCKCYLHGGVF